MLIIYSWNNRFTDLTDSSCLIMQKEIIREIKQEKAYNPLLKSLKYILSVQKYVMIAFNLCITIFSFVYTLLYHNMSCK